MGIPQVCDHSATIPSPQQSPPADPFNRAQIAAFVKAITDFDQGCIEFRVFDANLAKDNRIIAHPQYKSTVGGWFDSVEAIVNNVTRLYRISGYLTVNPVNPLFLARRKNKVARIDRGQGASDKDIVCLRWVFLDIDPKKPLPDISATETERQHAIDRRDKILTDHPDIRACSIWGGSGNGAWILVRLPDYPNDEAHNAIVGRFIDHFHGRYSDGLAEVDTKTRNASRIMGIPGTVKCKGEPTGGRLWRMATFDSMELGCTLTPPPLDLAAWVDSRAPQAAQQVMEMSPDGCVAVAIPCAVRPGADLDSRIVRATAYLARIAPAISGQDGHGQTFDAACALIKGFNLSIGIARPILTDWNTRCVPPWSEHEIEHKLQQADTKADDKPRGYLSGSSNEVPRFAIEPASLGTNFALTDLGNAERFRERNRGQVRHVTAWGKWISFDGRRWSVNDLGDINQRGNRVIRAIGLEAVNEGNDDQRKRILRHALASESAARIAAMLKISATVEGVPIAPEELDCDPYLFNCLNGTIDLRTGGLIPHRAEDLITQLCPLEYRPDAECPQWLGTLNLFFSGNPGLILYFQRILGYAMFGIVRDHILPVAYGIGANGKSTMLGTALGVFGTDYAMKAPPEMFMAKIGDSHPTDRADLFRKRLVVAIETEDGRKLNETMVKELTGGDPIRARRMRENFWEFLPSHTIILATNHKPAIKGTDDGIWRRVRLIPFAVKVDGVQADKSMPEKLRAEYPGILAWCVRGAMDWYANGLVEPEEVRSATQEYRGSEDIVGSFISENCQVGSGERVKSGDLYASYRQWANGTIEPALSQRNLGSAMTEKGFTRITSNGTWYMGISLRKLDEAQVVWPNL
ncbi:MAG: hypothetical protein JWN86_1417 [Planctomycetota bacterium]|nr:hypothetical protein [Planctomycetota bacterium]